MTDITELALLVSKAKASVFTMEYISQFEPDDIDSDDVDLRLDVDGMDTGTNVAIVDECGQAAKVIGALVEALEKAQQRIDSQREYYEGVIADGGKRLAELESRTVTVSKSDIFNVPGGETYVGGEMISVDTLRLYLAEHGIKVEAE
ncbi:TPA: hypothetical protein ACQ7DO_000311 [Klebsiella pneumoniae]|uniref:hypothetical protein n=1 Tax=Klebsiella pneumoniae TaxID=573 RepID=UPI0027B8DA15|nr:hypothetical protein [Klebsiella pneumoniae]WLY32465.1 hypothetical protein RA204_21240 [Klebsiella pneumoniae]